MKYVTLYSSSPETTQIACAFQGLRRAGLGIIIKPLSERPAPNLTRKQRLRLEDERNALRLQLATVGELLSLAEDGQRVLGAGQVPGLRAERDSLQARLRGAEATLQALKGGPADV
ncbi:MAG: hypothetical protein ACRYF0_02690 [Janthinobacterium lividum]